MQILYVGNLDENSNSYRRFKTVKSMGYTVTAINSDKHIYNGFFTKIHHHLNVGPGINKLNKKVLEEAKRICPKIIWVDNKSFLKTSILKEIKKSNPGVKIINLITDDITGKLKYQWRLALKNAKYYDCFFVQREANVSELKNYGAQRVELCFRSFDPEFHRPVILNEREKLKYRCPVGFVGTYESPREELIAHLIKNEIPVMVTGDGWPKGKYWEMIKPHYRGPSLYGEDYIKTINGMYVALHFLRHGNRDEQDSRTFEIPACGVFMLAEKSSLHSCLFKEGEEAIFFESKEDLLEKVKYFLKNHEERKAIAQRGYIRCKESYSHKERLKEVIFKTLQNQN